MVFNSYIFIFLFFPLTVLVYFLLNKYSPGKKGQTGLAWILGMSLWFYAYDIPAFLLLFLLSIIANYAAGKIITKLKCEKQGSKRFQKLIMSAGVLFNLALLFYFKYADFFVDSIEDFFGAEWNVETALPLGISFFTFLQIAYVVDCYREEKGFDYSFLEYAVYVAFFPKITMGPIVLHGEIIPQLRDRNKKNIDYDNMSKGLYAFSLGLGKKVLIADTLAKMVNEGFAMVGNLNTVTALIVMLSYTLQLYFDFSGYCDMAVGISKMMNIDLPYNFNSPYKAKSISEFWDRWHMTLTRFFTRYVYIPMGGSRKGKLRTYLNTLVVFLLSGLWHGADWTFLFWGFLHGILMVLEKVGKDLHLQIRKIPGLVSKILNGFRWLITFFLVNIAWVFFRSESIKKAFVFIKELFSGGFRLNEGIADIFHDLIEIRLLKRVGLESLLEFSSELSILLALTLLVLSTVTAKNTQEKMEQDNYQWKRTLVTMVLLVWSIVSLSSVSEFLYFNF